MTSASSGVFYRRTAVGLVMNCDKMVGWTFEKGLANLKALSDPALPGTESPR